MVLGVTVLIALCGAAIVAVASQVDPSIDEPEVARGTTVPKGSAKTDRTTTSVGSGKLSELEVEILSEVDELSKFVEQERGLEFLEPVNVEILDPDAFQERLLELIDEDEAETHSIETDGRMLQALGLIAPESDPQAVIRSLYSSSVAGFYDPETDELVVKAEEVGLMFREITVHELTHALDDQHFDLDRPDVFESTDGSEWPFTALVEGNARRVEYAFLGQLSRTERADLLEEFMGGGDSSASADLSLSLAMMLTSPYDYGLPFVEQLLASGGQSVLDEAFKNPPISDEQILEPDVYSRGEKALVLSTPPAEGEALDEGVLGALGTGFMFLGDVNMDDIFGRAASGELGLDVLSIFDNLTLEELNDGKILIPLVGDPSAVRGWGGDRYVVWEDSRRGPCIRVDWQMDSPDDLVRFGNQLEDWAQVDANVVVERPNSDTARMTRCAR